MDKLKKILGFIIVFNIIPLMLFLSILIDPKIAKDGYMAVYILGWYGNGIMMMFIGAGVIISKILNWCFNKS